MFAATCCVSLEPNSADDSLRILQREDVPECSSLDHLNWKCAYHVFEDLNASESYLLANLYTFNTDWMTEDFFGILGEVEAHACIFSQRQYRTPLNRLLKLGLVDRKRNPVQVAYTVPMATKVLFLHFLSVTKTHGGLATVISGSCELLHLVLGNSTRRPDKEYSKLLDIAFLHIKALCETAGLQKVAVGENSPYSRVGFTRGLEECDREH